MGNRGSEWSKWDLHVHTPASIVQNYGANDDATWERFVADLEALPKEFSVIGVNDYLFLDGYRRLNSFQAAGRLKNIKLLLPVIELRLAHFGGTDGEWSRVNLHVIFDSRLSPDEIEAYFLNALRASYQLSPQAELAQIKWSSLPTRESLADLGTKIIASVPAEKRNQYGTPLIEGFNNLNVTFKQVLDALGDGRLTSKFLLALGKTEWAEMKWTDGSIAEKKNLINKADLVFTAAKDPEAALKSRDKLRSEGVNASLLDCSDAHNFHDTNDKDRIGNCSTWIKSEPTFRGLKYAAIEYDSRVYLGESPPILSRVAGSPNAYIDSVSVVPTADCPKDKRWFDFNVSLNDELCCVIGNKGSGKSALTDFLALAANAHNEGEFSFLNRERFRRKPANLAQYFTTTIRWRSGRVSEKNLAESADAAATEEVRYLPQSYLEELCNEVPGGSESLFEKELKRIIFLNLSPAERARRAGLDELVAEIGREFELRIASIRKALHVVNVDILECEILQVPAHRKGVVERIASLEEQLRAHDETRPEAMVPPQQDPDTAAQIGELNAEIAAVQQTIDELNVERRGYEAEKAKAFNELNRLRTALSRLTEYGQESARAAEEVRKALSGLLTAEEIGKILTYRVEDARVRALVREREAKFAQMAALLEDAGEGGLTAKQRNSNKNLEVLKGRLGAPQRAYAQRMAMISAWEQGRIQIIGSSETADSLEWLRNQLKITDSAAESLQPRYEQRRKLVQELVAATEDSRQRLEVLYSAAAQKVATGVTEGASVPIEFTVKTMESGFAERFLEFINLRARSTFQGIENAHSQLRDMLANTDFGNGDSASAFVEAVLDRLRTLEVEGATGPRIDVQTILKGSFKAIEVYDYVTGLEYLRPSFRLTFEGRDVAVLSPGQRGMVLLLFYLLVDAEDIPLIVDQPEENLDNQTVTQYLVKAFKIARQRRQIIVVTHNSNLAVVCAADQVIRAQRLSPDGPFEYEVGSLEGARICDQVLEILEGTKGAFDRRSKTYAL